MYAKSIMWFGGISTLACDGNCAKAWGIHARPKKEYDPQDPDDYALLADSELGIAPANPRTYEGGCGKPNHPSELNKWCARECERSVIAAVGEDIVLPDFTRRFFNQPWKHRLV